MTADEIKKLLAPQTFTCPMCKKVHRTAMEAAKCQVADELVAEMNTKQQAEDIVKEQSAAEALKEQLERNLS